MRLVVLIIFSGCFWVLSQSAAAQTVMYGDVKIYEVEPEEAEPWSLVQTSLPYPNDLALDAVSGCLMADLKVNRSGRTKGLKITQTAPADEDIEKNFKKMLRRIQWLPKENQDVSGSVPKTIRVDFCMSNRSTKDAEASCQELAKSACE